MIIDRNRREPVRARRVDRVREPPQNPSPANSTCGKCTPASMPSNALIIGSGLGDFMIEEVKHLHNEVVKHGFRFNSHMSVVNLHPEVRRIAARLYEDGHYREAISAATKALEVAVRETFKPSSEWKSDGSRIR
jgi:hypothetical protein